MQARAKNWQTERANILQRVCVGIEQRLKRRRGARRAARFAARKWKNRHYRSEPWRRVQLSHKSIVDLFYVWKRSGRTPEAFALHYRPGRVEVPAALVTDFVRTCFTPGIYTLRDAYRELAARWREFQGSNFPFSYGSICRAVSPAERRREIIHFQKMACAYDRARKELINALLPVS